MYFEKHPEFKFAVVAGQMHGGLRSRILVPCVNGRKQELREGVNDVAGMIEDVEEMVIF